MAIYKINYVKTAQISQNLKIQKQSSILIQIFQNRLVL